MTNDAQNHIDILIESIASCQSRGDKFFPEGIFPSHRQNKYLFYKRPDTNIFYTATIVFILNQIKHKVSKKSQAIVEDITQKAIKNYPDFQNKDGLKTYNFWQTKPTNHFPNGVIFKRLDHFRIPDDIDDTALVYLTLPHSKEDVVWLKEKLKLHTSPEASVALTSKEGIYSTWFGKNMPIEFDVCALCNLMYLFEKHQLPYNEYDEAVFTFLREVILREEYITDAFKVAHNYATTPLIIYHYARLLGDFEVKKLEVCREKLIQKTRELLDNEKIEITKVILETSLMKLGGIKNYTTTNSESHGEPFRIARQTVQNRTANRSELNTYFIAGLLSSYQNPILHFFAPMKITQMEWKCEAHDLALILENLVVSST